MPIEAITSAFTIAKRQGITTVLNPSPVATIPADLIANTDIFILNEVELSHLAPRAATVVNPTEVVAVCQRWQLEIGPKVIVVTLGARGLVALAGQNTFIQPAPKVERIVDTTGAGDCFTGSLVALLHQGYSLEQSMSIAQSAAAISIGKRGASPSFPTKATVHKHPSFRV